MAKGPSKTTGKAPRKSARLKKDLSPRTERSSAIKGGRRRTSTVPTHALGVTRTPSKLA